MKSICIIPARGASKRIKRKNIIDFHGKPLIYYPIKAALKAKIFDELFVSTEDEEIARIARELGASVLIRKKELADDMSSSDAVIKDAIWDMDVEHVCCLYASAVLIDEFILQKAYEDFVQSKAGYLFSACLMDFPIQRAFYLENDRAKMFEEKNYYKRSQDLIPAYKDAGAFYFGHKKAWLGKEVLFSQSSKLYILPKYLSCDIDDMEDLELAKLLYTFKNTKNNDLL